MRNSLRYFNNSPAIIRLAVMMYVRFPLSLMHYLGRAVDHQGEVLEVFATKHRDRKAALAFLKWTVKRHGRPGTIVIDRLRSYGAAMKVIGNTAVHASIHNHFNQDCPLNRRDIFKQNRSAALDEWRQRAA